jgi:hypothetical protein
MIIYVDIDNTICSQKSSTKYQDAEPWMNNIEKINKLYNKGHHITYWTGRGSTSKIDWYDVTEKQLENWGCKYHHLIVGKKPHYDLLICDKTKRIEEI